jgi:signal transduction histidine kinase
VIDSELPRAIDLVGRNGDAMTQREKLLKRIKQLELHDLPIGAYVTDEAGMIIEANQRAREILQLPLEGQIDLCINDLDPNIDVRGELRRMLESLETQGHPPSVVLPIKVGGREMYLRDHSRVIRDEETSQIIGFLSFIEDITREYSLQSKIGDLTHDIGQVLHSYSSTLLKIQLSTSAILEGLKPDPFEGVTSDLSVAALTVFSTPARACASSLRQLLDLAESDASRLQALPEERWAELRRLEEVLKDYESAYPYPESISHVLQEASLKLIDICRQIRPRNFPRELMRQIKAHARELIRIYSLFMLHEISDVTLEMEKPVRALREFAISDYRVTEQKSVQDASDLLRLASDNLRDFARNRGIQLRKKTGSTSALVYVVERDVIRALSNIIHNAIKYSWSRGEGGGWVTVGMYVDDEWVSFEVENYGVPIPGDEIERHLIFELGFRGRLSGDRGRIGTGVGLADARRVAVQHGGEIAVKSRPAISGLQKEDNYEQPFVTTFTFKLPVYKGEAR